MRLSCYYRILLRSENPQSLVYILDLLPALTKVLHVRQFSTSYSSNFKEIRYTAILFTMINPTSTWFTTLLILFTTFVSGALAINQNGTIVPRDGDVGAEYKFYGFIGCTKEDTAKVYAAFKEKDTIVGSPDVWEIKWNNPAAVEYFG